jgi:hypothetical protein
LNPKRSQMEATARYTVGGDEDKECVTRIVEKQGLAIDRQQG